MNIAPVLRAMKDVEKVADFPFARPEDSRRLPSSFGVEEDSRPAFVLLFKLSIVQVTSQKLTRVGPVISGHLFGGAGSDDFTADVAALRTQVDDVVGHLDNVEMVLDHQHAVAGFDQPVQACEQVTMSARCSPVVGSSRIYRMLASRRSFPSSLASLMRWASPPESVVADCQG